MSTNNDFYAVIMAGGVGSRFWPVSRQEFPKQFHDMLGTGKTLLQATYERFAKFVPHKNILILTNAEYKEVIKTQLPNINNKQMILEPSMNNTAPCILLASLKINKENPNAKIVVAPSDHWIENEDAFIQDTLYCLQHTDDKTLFTLGILPSFPNTGYGYIAYNQSEEKIKHVIQFTEKPDYDTAKHFLKQGNYLWNAGIFIWSSKAILSSFQTYLPTMFNLFNAGIDSYNNSKEITFIKENYSKSENISVDYGILEKAKDVRVLPASFDWSDLGTWGSLYEKMPKDKDNNVAINATLLSENTQGNIIRTNRKKVVVIKDLSNYIIVEEDDVLLIYPKEAEQDVKKEREKVAKKFGHKFL